MLHVNGGAIPHQGLLECDDFYAGVLRAPLPLNRLVVNTDAGQAHPNGFRNQPAHGHNAP